MENFYLLREWEIPGIELRRIARSRRASGFKLEAAYPESRDYMSLWMKAEKATRKP